MKERLVTFHTHLGAVKLYRELSRQKFAVRMMPVPRVLSSSCGTCLRTSYDGPAEDLLTEDVQGVYEVEADGYRLLKGEN